MVGRRISRKSKSDRESLEPARVFKLLRTQQYSGEFLNGGAVVESGGVCLSAFYIRVAAQNYAI
jgi:hypothetical protein